MKPYLIILVTFLFPTLLKAQNDKIVVCYWGTWSHYRTDKGAFTVDKIPVDLCTHVIYSFAGLDPATNKIKSLDPWLDYDSTEVGGGLDMIKKTVDLRNINPNLKISIAVGGWNEGSINYSLMSKNPSSRATFIQSVVEFIEKFDLDGFDMDWEYPGNRDGAVEDKVNFPLLLKEFREAFDKVSRPPGREPLLLTSAFGCAERILDSAYDIPEINKWIDFYHLMLYDYKMYIDNEPGGNLIGHHSPLFSKSSEDPGNQSLTNSFSVESFIERGATPAKLVFGVGAYGKTYELFNRSQHNFYDEAKGPGAESTYSQQAGTSSLYEICLELLENPENWEIGMDADYKIPYAFSDSKWIGFDNEMSAKMKVDYAMSKELGGMMVWSLDFDDFDNLCGGWEKFPIVFSLHDRLQYHQKLKASGR